MVTARVAALGGPPSPSPPIPMLRTATPLLPLALLGACAAVPGPAGFFPDGDKKNKLGLTEDISLIVGTGFTQVDSSTDGAPQFDGDTDESDSTLQAGVAVKFHPQVSAELAYVDLGRHTWNGTWNNVPDHGHIDFTGFRVGVTGEFPMNESDWSWLATGGLFLWEEDGEEVFGGNPEPPYDDTGTDLYIGGGVQYRINDVLAARLLLTRSFDVGGDDVDALMLDLLYSVR